MARVPFDQRSSTLPASRAGTPKGSLRDRVAATMPSGSLRDRLEQAETGREKLMILMDVSISMGAAMDGGYTSYGADDSRLGCAKRAITKFLDLSDPVRAIIGLMAFSNHTDLCAVPTPHFNQVERAASGMSTMGGTNMAGGLKDARAQAPTRVILVSDGAPDSEPATLRVVETMYVPASTPIDAIYIGLDEEPGADFLKKICTMTGGIYATVNSVESLERALTRLETSARLMITHQP